MMLSIFREARTCPERKVGTKSLSDVCLQHFQYKVLDKFSKAKQEGSSVILAAIDRPLDATIAS